MKKTATEDMVKDNALGYSGRFEVYQLSRRKLALLVGVLDVRSMVKKLGKYQLLTCLLDFLIFRLHLCWKISIVR